MKKEFTEACDNELKENLKKGDWDSWLPNEKQLTVELNWHMAKLNHAILQGDPELIREYSCDVANYCQKAYDLSASLWQGYRKKADILHDY